MEKNKYAEKVNTVCPVSMLSRRKKVVVVASLLLAICILLFVSSVFFHSVPSRPGEGYMDPSSGIHITPVGDITDSAGTSSNINIRREGNIYTLMGNITSPVTIEKSNVVFDGQGFSFVGSHGLILSGTSNVTVKDLSFETHYFQIMLKNAKNNVVQNVTSSYRILLSYSDNNLINNCTGDPELDHSNGNTIKNCATGEITLSRSNGNSLLYNTIWTQGPSLGLWQSSDNLIFGNSFQKFWWWISVNGDNNKIVANDVWAGQIYLADKLGGTNYIYHNNFYNFKWNQSATTNSANVWSSDDRGNYWGYSGTDMNHDGIGDHPYVIDKTNTDNYPLMAPVNIAAEPLP